MVFTTLEENHNIVSISNLMFEDEEYHSPIKRERQLLNALKAGDADEAEKVLDMIYEEFSEQKKNSLSINKKICTELIVVCIKSLYPMGMCLNELFQTEDDPIYLIHDQKSITDVKKSCTGRFARWQSASERKNVKFLKSNISKLIPVNNSTIEEALYLSRKE